MKKRVKRANKPRKKNLVVGGKKVIVVIRDGWGYRKGKKDNAIVSVSTPVDDYLMETYSNTLLCASDGCVGLPKKFMGNSEVGHLTMGAGRVEDESLIRINKAIGDGSFFKKKEFLDAIKNCQEHGSHLHLVGLAQTAGVHSHLDHLFALLDLCKKKNFKDVYLHLFTDGRDAPVHKGVETLELVKRKLKQVGFGKIVSISGRYYAMDRDQRWPRTKHAYNAIMKGECPVKFINAKHVLEKNYHKGIGDEFIFPSCHLGYKGVMKNDSLIFFNFRTDRLS